MNPVKFSVVAKLNGRGLTTNSRGHINVPLRFTHRLLHKHSETAREVTGMDGRFVVTRTVSAYCLFRDHGKSSILQSPLTPKENSNSLPGSYCCHQSIVLQVSCTCETSGLRNVRVRFSIRLMITWQTLHIQIWCAYLSILEFLQLRRYTGTFGVHTPKFMPTGKDVFCSSPLLFVVVVVVFFLDVSLYWHKTKDEFSVIDC